MPNEITVSGLRITPDKRFFRLDESFNDAVRSRKTSAIMNVLLRAQLPGELALRTAEKILLDRRRRHR
jgi:hypothetical protein